MVMLEFGEQISSDEQQVVKILISIICLYGNDGLPLDQVENEYYNYAQAFIPWKKFGATNLRSWLITVPNIYIVMNQFYQEVLIAYSPKSRHIKDLITKQRRSHYRTNPSCTFPIKKNGYHPYKCNNTDNQDNGYSEPYKMKKRLECENLPKGAFIHTSILNVSPQTNADRYEKFEELESMLPLFYKHQALGDDFFVDIADTKLGYYVPERGPKETGLCTVGQTIKELTEKVRRAVNLAPRVVVMIGFQDLLEGHSISTMVTDLRQLVVELKKKNTHVTLVTLIPSPKLPNLQRYETRMNVFNNALLEYASDPLLQCNIIDMNTIFMKETEKFKRDFYRFRKVAKNDPYKVFSDYGRKIFLSGLKSCLKEQIEFGH